MALEGKMSDMSLWFYRGEGNDTMVVGLRGQNLVLRLKKRLRQKTGKIKDQNGAMNGIAEQHDNSLDFSKNVFLPLMGGKYVRVGEIVRLPHDFAAQLDIVCEPFRPKHRLHKGIDTSAATAIAMADFCHLPEDKPWNPHLGVTEKVQDNGVVESRASEPTFSVEIKPKCGFIPTSSYIKKEHFVKLSTCHYCMLQRTKVAEGKYTRPSQYCPVNLFSGDINRVFFALQSLVLDPQNNLRIFKDGFPIFTEEIVQDAIKNGSVCCSAYVLEKTLICCGWTQDNHPTHPQSSFENHTCDKLGQYSNNFMKTVLQILVDDSKISSDNIPQSGELPKQVCEGSCPVGHIQASFKDNKEVMVFGRGGVLGWMNLVQRMDDIDVEGLYPLHIKIKKHFEHNPEERERFSVDGPYKAGIWNDVRRTNSVDKLHKVHFPNLNQIDSWSTKDIIFKICQFAVASTAKDCSLMLTFQRHFTKPKHLPFIVDSTHGHEEYIVYNIDLVDLDPKEFDRVQKYYNDSCNAVRQYLKAL